MGNTVQVGNMILYERTRTIHIGSNTCQLSKNEFRLLWMFATTPGHCLTMQKIQNDFWPGNMNASGNMYTLIRTLRSSLEDFPEYQVEVMKKEQKYRLKFA